MRVRSDPTNRLATRPKLEPGILDLRMSGRSKSHRNAQCDNRHNHTSAHCYANASDMTWVYLFRDSDKCELRIGNVLVTSELSILPPKKILRTRATSRPVNASYSL